MQVHSSWNQYLGMLEFVEEVELPLAFGTPFGDEERHATGAGVEGGFGLFHDGLPAGRSNHFSGVT
jgi:hypothetical protein